MKNQTYITFKKIISLLWIFLILQISFIQNRLGIASEISASIDLMIVYIFLHYCNISPIPLFIFSIIIDAIYKLPFGSSGIGYLLALHLMSSSKYINPKCYYITKFIGFIYFSFIVITSRYFIVLIFSEESIEGIAIFFHFFVTIFSYPLLESILNKPIKIICNYVR